MGVPTVTLAGQAFFERLSFSTLSNAGLADLAAPDAAGYVARAVALAADPARRRALRVSLRQDLRSSTLGDNARWVREFERQVERL